MCTTLQTENPTKRNAKDQRALKQFFQHAKQCMDEQPAAAQAGLAALPRLVKACCHKGDTSYRLRGLLYSLFNGHPANLNDIQCLDWSLRKDLAAVILGMGSPGFSDDMILTAFETHNLGAWFLQAKPEAE